MTQISIVKWKGCNEDNNTWEEVENLDCKDIIKAFNKKKRVSCP